VGDTYNPEIYDLFHPPDAGDNDIEYYRTLAVRDGGPVLELGCGTGRTLLPIANAGVEIHGLDNSSRMLAALEERLRAEPTPVRNRVQIHSGDMAKFEFPDRYAVVQIPFRGFLHNVTPEQQRACLRCCWSHLRAGGCLVFSVFHPSLELTEDSRTGRGPSGMWRWRGERALPDGGFVALSDCISYDTVQQTLAARLRYERYDTAGQLVNQHLHRLDLAYLYPRDLEDLLHECGFTDVTIEGGFAGAPFSDHSQDLIVQARRP
jgi:SAM-dependent methyltransferase